MGGWQGIYEKSKQTKNKQIVNSCHNFNFGYNGGE